MDNFKKVFQDFLNEKYESKVKSFGHTVLGTVDVTVSGKKYGVIISHHGSETVASLDTASGKRITGFPGKLSIEEAKEKIEKYLSSVGDARVKQVFDKTIDADQKSANDTEWEVFSEYTNTRNRVVIRIFKRVSGGKEVYKEDTSIDKYQYIGLKFNADFQATETAMKKIFVHYKLKHYYGHKF